MNQTTPATLPRSLRIFLNFGLLILLILAAFFILIQKNRYRHLDKHAQEMKTLARSLGGTLIGQPESHALTALGKPTWTLATEAGNAHTWHLGSSPGFPFHYEQRLLIQVDSAGIIRSFKIYQSD